MAKLFRRGQRRVLSTNEARPLKPFTAEEKAWFDRASRVF